MGDRALVVGRELALGVVEDFVLGCGDGPASLVIEGVAGIGKTAIWSESLTIARAHGVEVRSSRCGEADARLDLRGLG